MSAMLEQLKKAHDIDSRYMHARQQTLYSSIRLGAYADQFGRVDSQRISFFQSKENTVGQGFVTPLHRGLTNFQGAPSTMPIDQLYVAKAFGIRLVSRRAAQTPRAILKDLTDGTCSIDVRRGDNTSYNLGALEHWPCGRFGLSSRAVTGVGLPPANGELSLIDYPTNGDAGMRVFEDGSELVFKQGSLIEVTLNIHETLWLTDDGGPNTDPDLKRDLIIQAVFDGYSLSQVSG